MHRRHTVIADRLRVTCRASADPLYRAYLIKEQLRETFAVKGRQGRRLLIGVIAWAFRSRIPEMVALAETLRRFPAPRCSAPTLVEASADQQARDSQPTRGYERENSEARRT